MSKYILETNELTKVFGKQKAVNNVSLKIEENSVYGLLGPNRDATLIRKFKCKRKSKS